MWIFYLFYCITYCSVSIIGLKKIFPLFSVTTHNVDQFIGFSTARGEKLSISEDAIEKANFVLSDEKISAYAEKDTGKKTKNVILCTVTENIRKLFKIFFFPFFFHVWFQNHFLVFKIQISSPTYPKNDRKTKKSFTHSYRKCT